MTDAKTVIANGFWPIVVTAAIVLTALGVARGHAPGTVLFVTTLATLAVTMAAEQLVPHRAEWNPLTDRQSLNDVGHGVLQSQVGDRLGEILLLTLGTAGAAGVARLLSHPAWPTAWPLGAQVLLGVVAADGLDYWKHRALHTEAGWRLHALHHGITRLHALKSARSHVCEVVLRFLMVYVPLLALGAPREVVFWHAALIGTLGVVGHSNVCLHLPSVVHRLLMTPHVHRLHHAEERSVADSNFANVLPVWDMVFGTYADPGDHVVGGVGVVGDAVPRGFAGQVLYPFRRTVDTAQPRC